MKNDKQVKISNHFTCSAENGGISLKHRIANIFDDNKKRRGIIVIAVILIIAVIAGSFVVFGSENVKQTNKSLTIYTFGEQEIHNDPVKEKYEQKRKNEKSYNRYYHTLDPYDVKAAVEGFKTKYPDIEINLVKFDDGTSDLSAIYDRLSTELMAGKGPDVIIVDSVMCMEKDVNKLLRSGVFEPLDDFIAADEEFHKRTYYEPIMEQGFYRGERYLLPLRFSTPVMASTEKVIKENNFNIDNLKKDYLSYMQEINSFVLKDPEKASKLLFTKNVSLNQLLYYMDVAGVNGVPNKNTPEMKQLLELFKPLSELEFVGENRYISPYKVLYTYDLLRDYGNIFVPSINDYEALNEISNVDDGTAPVLVPMRRPDGGINAIIDLCAGINENSPNHQNAYNFISMLLGRDSEFYYQSGLSPSKETMEGIVRSQSRYSSYKDTYEKYLSYLDDIDNAYFLSPLDKEIAQQMDSYFNNQKSYEECIKVVQQKVDVYLAE